jgi:hypothetical protein
VFRDGAADQGKGAAVSWGLLCCRHALRALKGGDASSNPLAMVLLWRASVLLMLMLMLMLMLISDC